MSNAALTSGEPTADGCFEYIVSARTVEQTARHKWGLYWSFTVKRSKIPIDNVVSPLEKYMELKNQKLLADFWVNVNPVSIKDWSVTRIFDKYIAGEVVYPTQLYIDRAIVQSYLARRDAGEIAKTEEAYKSVMDELRLRTDFAMIGQEYCVNRAVANPKPVNNTRRRPRRQMMMPSGRTYHSPPPEVPKGVPWIERGRGCWGKSLPHATEATRGEVAALLKQLFDLPHALRELEACVDYAAIEAEMAESEASMSSKNSDSKDDDDEHDDDDGRKDDGGHKVDDGRQEDEGYKYEYEDGYEDDDEL